MKIQITGVPGSGKTTATEDLKVSKIDIATYTGRDRETQFIRDAMSHRSSLLIESACGCEIPGTKVVRLKVAVGSAQQNFYTREKCELPASLIALYNDVMIPCHYIAYDTESLKEIVKELIKENKEDKRQRT